MKILEPSKKAWLTWLHLLVDKKQARNGIYCNITESILNLVNAVEEGDISLSSNDENVKLEEAKATVTKYWDVIQVKTQKVDFKCWFLW